MATLPSFQVPHPLAAGTQLDVRNARLTITAMSQEYRIISLDRVESLRIKNNTAMLDGGTFAEIDDEYLRERAGDIKDVTGHEVNFPMIGDPDRTVANLYDMIHPNASDTATVTYTLPNGFVIN